MQSGEKCVWFQGKCFDCNEKFLQAKLAQWKFTYDPTDNYHVQIRLEADQKNVRVKVLTSTGTNASKNLVTKYYTCPVEDMVDQWVKV